VATPMKQGDTRIWCPL